MLIIFYLYFIYVPNYLALEQPATFINKGYVCIYVNDLQSWPVGQLQLQAYLCTVLRQYLVFYNLLSCYGYVPETGQSFPLKIFKKPTGISEIINSP